MKIIYLLAGGIVQTHALQLCGEQRLAHIPLLAALSEGKAVARHVILKVYSLKVNVSCGSCHKGEHSRNLHHIENRWFFIDEWRNKSIRSNILMNMKLYLVSPPTGPPFVRPIRF